MRVFYDVDTQNDFMNKNGALYVPGAESIKQNLKKLTEFARKNNIPIIGSVDRHFGTLEYKEREKELQRWGGPFPDHCMDGTQGAKKIEETSCDEIYIAHRLDNRVDETELIRAIYKVFKDKRGKKGLFFEKQSYDVFTNPAFCAFFDIVKIREAVVYGVATDYCVKAAVLGMQKRGIQCYVVVDAIKGVSPDTTRSALEEMVNAGAKFVTTKQVLK